MKKAVRDIHERHTIKIRNGALDFWKEDVKQNGAVNELPSSFTEYYQAGSTVISPETQVSR
jgi:hypothetical protein